MEIQCDYCNEINSVPKYGRGWPPLVCYNCGAELTTKFYRFDRHKSAYSRNPLTDDDTPDYPFPSPSTRVRDFSPSPRRRIDASRYARPFEMRDSLYPADSEFHTPRMPRRCERPTYADDLTPDFRREKTDLRFEHRSRLTADKLPPPPPPLTPRMPRRYERPTYADDLTPDFRREKTDLRFEHRSRLTADKLPPPPPPLKYSREYTFSKPKLIREPSSRRHRFCSYQNLCREYVWSLNWPREYFDNRFNRCYCSECYPPHYKDVYKTAGETYVIPRGWVRFGLYVDKVKADCENLWDTWIVTYHGTKIPAARSILGHRQFLLPGDTCDDGTLIGIREGHIPGKNQVYTSPTIKYSSMNCYCERYNYRANDGKQYEAKIVLQCRQQPGTYNTQPETVGSGSIRICPIITNDRIEIFTTVRAAVVPYGLLVQLTPK